MKKIIAWYLPQFHCFPENDINWGKGFTEWTLVNAAIPQYPNHRILKPHKDIGYYCLEDIAIRKLQGELAKQYGIYGFCYYHYWFSKPVMNKPLELMLLDGHPDISFCFSWANEPWKKSMNGGDNSIILKQNYGEQKDWELHFQYLLNFFKHHNYIKINNKPLFVVYRVNEVSRYKEMFDYWRSRCKEERFNGMFITSTLGNFLTTDPHEEIADFVDAAVEFYPNFLGDKSKMFKQEDKRNFYNIDMVYDYIFDFPKYHDVQFKSILTNFDTSPRSCKRCNIFVGATPEKFGKGLSTQCKNSKEEFVFVNAWNEWSESAVLEPEEVYGYEYLNMVKIANKNIGFI